MFCLSPVKLLQTEENPEAIFNCLHRFPFDNPPRADQTFCRDGSEVLALHETGFLKAGLRRCDRYMRTNALGPGRDGKDNDKTGGTVVEVINGDYQVFEGRFPLS
jgi:hypothetical protein